MLGLFNSSAINLINNKNFQIKSFLFCMKILLPILLVDQIFKYMINFQHFILNFLVLVES